MKLYGRITVFGEYLLHNMMSHCMVIKSKSFLTNERSIIHPNYESARDESIGLLKNNGFNLRSDVFGNLALGAGLSSSTILTSLHLNSFDNRELIELIDERICGFEPSGLDYESIKRQEDGLYNGRNWISLPPNNIFYSILLPEKENELDLIEVQKRVLKTRDLQIMYSKILKENYLIEKKIQLNAFKQYCNSLLECDVYSNSSRKIISEQSKRGNFGKCIGGLYDKAILFIHESWEQKKKFDIEITSLYNMVKLLE